MVQETAKIHLVQLSILKILRKRYMNLKNKIEIFKLSFFLTIIILSSNCAFSNEMPMWMYYSHINCELHMENISEL